MANGANIVVPVGVQLELNNVQEIISSLQKAMSNVKPDTKGYAGIVSELSKAEKRADSLASKLSQGFTTKAGLQSFTKGFEDLIAMVDVVNNKVGQINFDNLTLTADQQAKMNEFTKNIQDARDAYNAFETDKLRDAVSASQDLQNVFKRLNLNIDTTSLDSAINSIKTKIASLQKEMDAEAKKATANEARAASRQSEIDELSRLKKLFTSNDLSKTFPDFFKADGNFKNGGKQAFVNLLKQLGIDNDTIELVKKTAGNKIKEIQAEMEKAINTRIKTKESQRNTASDNAKAARDAVERLTAEQKENINSQQELQNVQNNPEMVQARKQETDAIEQENVKIRELIQLVMQAFNGGLGKNSNDLKAALDAIRESGGAAAAELENLNQRTKTVENIKRSVSMWMGFNQVLRLTRTAIKNVVKDIRDLDKVMTEIAVVTNMSQKDLWNQMNTYQGIAKQYGVATTGVYQVSQIYYQQGLQTSDVMALTNETLKMAKIAGLDYGAAADYMTVAIRGFKMEMTDAQNVVDVYSNLAAKSASDTTELATAMSKTASSAAAVGSSFENTSAMIAMMVETTRESAENIGSALKSIISRYGEMKSDPSKLIDSEGEALSLNKVDTALQSIGISLHDAQGQFRDFDDVILELSSKWDTLDKNSQRYIATIMAGNRQQSRFLALVSDYDRLSELTEEAANSEDAALVQTLKTMDSLETKIQNVKNAFQGFYGNLGLESVFKGALDVITNIINRLNAMPKAFGKIPIAAIGMVANIINVIKTLGTTLITVFAAQWSQIRKIIETSIAGGAEDGVQQAEQKMDRLTPKQKKQGAGWAIGSALSLAGAGLSTWALTMKDSEAPTRGMIQSIGGLTSGIGSLVTSIAMIPGPAGIVLGLISAATSAMPGLIAGINDLKNAKDLELKASRDRAKQLQENATLATAEARDLENTVEKLEKLNKAKNDSNEAYQEWIDYANQVANQYPELISMYDSEGNAVLDMSKAYEQLAESRKKASQAAADSKAQDAQLKLDEINRMNAIADREIAITNAGDQTGKGTLRNIYSIRNFDNKAIVDFSSGKSATFSKSQMEDIFDINSLEYGFDEAGQSLITYAKVSKEAIKKIQNWEAGEGKDFETDEELKNAREAVADLYYEQFLKPLAKNELLTDFGIDNLNSLESLSSAYSGEALVNRYLDLMSQIENKLAQDKEYEKVIADFEASKSSVDNAFQSWVVDQNKALDQAILSKFAGNSLMQSLAEKNIKSEQIDENGNFTQDGQDMMDALYQFYSAIDEETFQQISSLLAHPEAYTSQEDLKNALVKILGDQLGNELIGYIVQVGEDGTNYLSDIWKHQNQSLQNNFKRNIQGSKKINSDIEIAAIELARIGDNLTVLSPEIAAQYLNDINKQWTDLVTKQKNEAVATQNAKFLADTYVDVGQLSEEANGAMANILSTAELNTRDGIQKAIDQIEAYQADNDLSESDVNLLVTILESLKEHKDNLLLNLNTEFQQYADSLSDAVKNVNQNYTNNTSGFGELKDANEVLQKINSGKLATDQLTFDEAFSFDENLGKYVFTVQGLMEANNAQMEDINSQYEAAEKQLQARKGWLEELPSQTQGFAKGGEALDNQIKSINESSNYSEEQKVYLIEIANSWAASNLEWDKFIKNEQEKLEKMGLSAEQAKVAAENMTKEAQKRNAIESLDISGITKSSKTFSEVEQSIINYLTTGLGFIFSSQEAAEHAALNVYNNLKGGGQEAADFYKRNLANSEDFQAEVYNEILNQPAEASKSLLSKLNNSIGQSSIQLTQAEATLLQELGVENAETSITVDRLREKAGDLFDNLQEAVEQGSVSLADANKEIFENKLGDELKLEKQTSALTSLMTSDDLNISNLENFATALGATAKFADNFNIDELAGIKELDNGKKIIDPQKIQEFVADFNEKVLGGALEEDDINNIIGSLELADKSKITDAAVQAENSIIESIANEINNIKNAGIDKKVNLTYLQNKLGDDNLSRIFGDAYQNGTLTVTSAVKADMYNSLKDLKNELSTKGYDTSELTDTLIQYVDSSISDLTEYVGEFTVSDETAQVLAEKSSMFKKRLESTGKITIDSITEFAYAANIVYTEVSDQYTKGLANLTQLNSSYANVIKSNLAKQNAGFSMLTSATGFDLSSLQNFLNVYDKQLSEYITKMGDITTQGAAAGLTSLGNGRYQIADWQKFISKLQFTANQLSTEYIDAYVAWLESDVNVAPNAKEAVMTSLIPNMEKLSYAQIGQIAKTFKMTVDQVLNLVENNGDNTFNAAALLNTLKFDKSNKEFVQALVNQKQTLASNLISQMTTYIEAGADGELNSFDTQALDEGVNNYVKGMRALGISVEIDAEKVRKTLSEGGESAVRLAESIARESNQELSNQDIETLYRSSVTSFVNAIDTVMAKPGEIVDRTTANLIRDNGGKVNQLGATGQFVVESAANLYEAYKDLLLKLKDTGEATLADINKVAALALENRDGEQIAIDALGDAAGMTFTRFGEILADAGFQLTESLVNSWSQAGIIKQLGGNKMQIVDFKQFAALMNWQPDSEEYLSAFKTYNDSLVELNHKAERNIVEEVQSISNAQGGDWINLTQLWEKLNHGVNLESLDVVKINAALDLFGARIEDGILKLAPEANISAVMQKIAQVAEESGDLLSNELAELADTVADTIKGYADLISGAIEGSLTNTQADQLQNWAKSTNIGKLNFTKTNTGLKLATDQAYKLYAALKQIDAVQARSVFDNLAESLRTDKGGDFSSASKTMAAVARIQQEIEQNTAKVTEAKETGLGLSFKEWQALEKQNEKLKEKLSLYKQLQREMAMSNMDNPESYDFMNQDLPKVFQGPINYWNSVGKAFSAMNNASKTGKMEIQDFYNIVTEMSNLAAMGGQEIKFMGQSISGDLTSAANLIEAGFNSLSNVDGSGVKIDMGKLAANLQTGAEDMGKGFDDAIHSMAASQVAMLDGMIKLLETIVAMEKLGEVDIDNNGLLSIGEIFNDDGSFTALFDGVREYLLNSKELQPLLDDLRVSGITLRQLLDQNQDVWREAGISEQQYANIMSAFYQAALSDNYDLDNLISSVLNVLSGTGQVYSYYDQNTGYETVIDMNGRTYTVNWNDEDEKKRIYKAFKDAGYKPENGEKITDELIRGVLNQGHAGKLRGEALIAYDLVYGIITEYHVTDENGKETGETYYLDQYGNKYTTAKEAVVGNEFAKQKAGGNEAQTAITDVVIAGRNTGIKKQTFKTESGFEYTLLVGVDGKSSYQTTDSRGETVTGDSYQEMIDNLLNKEAGYQTGGARSYDELSKEEQIELRRRLNIITTPDVIFKDSSGKEYDPANDTETQRQLSQFLNQSHDKIQEQLHDNEDGTYTITLFDGSTIDVKAENTEEAIAKIQQVLDPLTGVISAAITNAFTNKDTGVQDAIATAIQKAFTNYDASNLTETPEIPSVDATIGMVNITEIKNASMGGSGLGKIGNSFKNLFGGSDLTIPSATAKIENLKLDASTTSNAETLGQNLGNTIGTGIGKSTTAIEQATSIGTKIAEAAQAALDANPLTFTIETPDDNNGDKKDKPKGSKKTGGSDSGGNGVSNKVDTPKQTSVVPTLDLSGIQASITSLGAAATLAAAGIALAKLALSGIQTEGVTTAASAINSISSDAATTAKNTIETIDSSNAKKAKQEINTIDPRRAVTAKSAINHIEPGGASDAKKAINNIQAPRSLSSKLSVTLSSAKGNMGNFAHAKGNVALAGGQNTLMGELGPELVVSNGRYFIVGQNGAEFVNLDKDAIVFNHLQTKRLMKQGAISSYGTPFTNERNAVSYAKGNKISLSGKAAAGINKKDANDSQNSEPQKVKSVSLSPTTFTLNFLKGTLSSVPGSSLKSFAKGSLFGGPAKASVGAALSALKQLRAMWQSLLNASLKDMGGMPSGGGGGGGGGGGSDKTKEAAEGIANAAERWYNWLVLIEEIQNKINILQKEYSLLEKQNLSTDQKKEKLLEKYNQLLDERATREQLSIEQQQYRTKLAEDANKGLFSAFYRVAPETGRVFYANDQAFIEYARKNKPSVDEKNLAWALANNGSIKANTTVKGTYSSEEATKKAEQVVKKSYGKSTVPQYLKDYYKKGKLIKGKEKAAKTAARKHWMEQEKKFTTKKTITTGKDFLEELNATDKAGNLIHNAAEQLALIKRMGIYSNDLEAGVDKEQDGWEATVVQNFFDKIDNDKAEIEALNKSIQEQEEGSKEAAIAMQEINDELRNLYKPITGVTEGLDEWYNVLRKLTDLQNQYNLVTKKATVLEKENIINGTEQYKNLQEQARLLKEQQKVNNEMFNTRLQKGRDLTKNAGGLEKFFSIDKNTGSAAFNKVLSKTITYKTSDKVATTTRNGRTYEVDEEGRYIDENGIIHDNNGRVLKDGEFGKLKIQEGINRTETFSGDIVEILEKLTAQDVTGKTAYNADEQYQILKSLGLEKFMQYDEKGGQIYSQFGEMTKEEQQKAVEAGIKRLQSYVEDINSNNDEIAKLEQENVDLTSSLLDIENKIRDLNIDIENQMHEAIVQDRQNEIDTRTEIKDALKDAADKTVEGLKESLEKEKQISQSKQDENDLIKIQNQLNLLRSAGGSNSKIRELELQAQKKQQDIYFNEREQTINAIEEASNKQIEALETQIDIMQTSLDVQVKYGLLWDEVNSKLNSWNIPEIVSYIAQITGILSKNPEERDKLYNELASKIGVIAAAVGDKQGIDTASSDTISRDQFLNKELNNYGDLSESYRNYLLEQGRKAYDSNKELTEKERQAKAKESINKAREKVAGNVSKLSSSIEEAKRATGKKYEDTTSLFNEAKAKYESGSSESEVKDYINKNLSKYEKQEIKTPEPKVETKTIKTSQQDKETTQPQQQQQQSQNEKSQVDKQENKEAASKTTSSVILTTTKKGLPRFIAPERNYKQAQNNKAKMKKGTKLKVIGIQAAGKETYITKNSGKRPMLKIDYNGKIRYVPYWYGYFPEGKKGVASLRAKLPTFKQGGAIDFTGPAWVDGTKEKPEQIFNYEQMEALREYMLNSVNTTKLAIAGLNSILDNLPDAATYNSINNTNSGITIDNLEFHMEVKEISNDYDARRAGQEAMAEMVRIARKTGNRSITRR